EIGPLEVSQLSLLLPNLRFPLDLSGGVPRFRHRRGDLEHARLGFELGRASTWLLRRLGDLPFAPRRPPQVWTRADAIGFGFAGERAALAFDLLWAPDGNTARFVVAHTRGVGLAGPALGFALRTLDSAIANVGERRGRTLVIEDAGRVLGRV